MHISDNDIIVARRMAHFCKNKYGYKDEHELRSVCYEAITVACASDPSINEDREAFMAKTCLNAMYTFLANNARVRVPRRTQERNNTRVAQRDTELDPEDISISNLTTEAELEILDCLEVACETDMERIIMDLKVKGYRDVEIIELLGIIKTDLYRAKSRVRKRFAKLWSDNGTL